MFFVFAFAALPGWVAEELVPLKIVYIQIQEEDIQSGELSLYLDAAGNLHDALNHAVRINQVNFLLTPHDYGVSAVHIHAASGISRATLDKSIAIVRTVCSSHCKGTVYVHTYFPQP